jgi:hypothetical protein
MNVRELIEELENYGDHLPVQIVVNTGERDKVYPVEEVTTRVRTDETWVTLEVEAVTLEVEA